MLVGRGALSFRTFQVTGTNPTPKKERILERLEQFSFAGIQSTDEGATHGWVGPEHIFDGDFSLPKIFRGRYVVFAFRVDTRRVPGPLLKAHLAIACEAAMEAEGLERLGARQKREIKLEVKRQLLAETPPQQRAFGVFWNLSSRRLFLQATSKSVVEAFRSLFERSFELNLEPQLPGLVASAFAQEQGRLEALKDARPLELTLSESAEPALAMA